MHDSLISDLRFIKQSPYDQFTKQIIYLIHGGTLFSSCYDATISCAQRRMCNADDDQDFFKCPTCAPHPNASYVQTNHRDLIQIKVLYQTFFSLLQLLTLGLLPIYRTATYKVSHSLGNQDICFDKIPRFFLCLPQLQNLEITQKIS